MNPYFVPMQDSKVRLAVLDEQLHLENCLKWFNDPEIQQFIKISKPIGRTFEKKWFEKLYEDKTNLVWAINVLENGAEKHVGTIGLHRINYRLGIGTSAMVIGEKDYWNQRIGTRAKMILLNYAFNVLRFHKVDSAVVEFNERSARCLLRCGYKEEGRRRQAMFQAGRWWDRLEFGIFREEFEDAYSKLKEAGEVD